MASSVPRRVSFGMNASRPIACSTTGWRPPTISSAPSSTISGRTYSCRTAMLGEAQQRVQPGQRRGAVEQRPGDLGRRLQQLGVDGALQPDDLLLGVAGPQLVLLELRRHEPLDGRHRLLADVLQPLQVLADRRRAGRLALVVVGRLGQRRPAQLQVVAEDPVVADLQAAQAGPLALRLFEVGDPGPGVARPAAGPRRARPSSPGG